MIGLCRHVGLRCGMLISDGSPISHIGLPCVSNQACRSLLKHVEVSNRSPIRHVGLRCVSDRSSMGLQSGMSVSDVTPIRHVGLC